MTFGTKNIFKLIFVPLIGGLPTNGIEWGEVEPKKRFHDPFEEHTQILAN